MPVFFNKASCIFIRREGLILQKENSDFFHRQNRMKKKLRRVVKMKFSNVPKEQMLKSADNEARFRGQAWRVLDGEYQRTVVWNSQKSRRKYWATRSSVRSFTRTAHSLACSRLLASLAPSAALTRSLARSLRSLPRSWESGNFNVSISPCFEP